MHKYIYVYVHIVLGRKTREATKMINMEKVRAECKEWQPKSGQARYYIDNWKQISGIRLEYHSTGKLESVNIDGEYKAISNHAWSKYCANMKVWVGAEDCEINIDYCNWDYVRDHVFKCVYAHYRCDAVE